MLSITGDRSDFIRIRAADLLKARDYRDFEPLFAAELCRRKRPVALLLDMKDFRGWTPAGLLRDLRFDLKYRRVFARIAVVGTRLWHRWLAYAAAPVFRAELKYFRAGEEQIAETWLTPR